MSADEVHYVSDSEVDSGEDAQEAYYISDNEGEAGEGANQVHHIADSDDSSDEEDDGTHPLDPLGLGFDDITDDGYRVYLEALLIEDRIPESEHESIRDLFEALLEQRQGVRWDAPPEARDFLNYIRRLLGSAGHPWFEDDASDADEERPCRVRGPRPFSQPWPRRAAGAARSDSSGDEWASDRMMRARERAHEAWVAAQQRSMAADSSDEE